MKTVTREIVIEDGVKLKRFIRFYDNGQVRNEVYCKSGKKHREGDKPSEVWYHDNGQVECERYFKNGKLHRDGDKPAHIEYHEDGQLECQYYFNNGKEYLPIFNARC